MLMISCGMRCGRSEEEKRARSAGLLLVVIGATVEPLRIIREGAASILWNTGNICPSSSRVARTTRS
jgi:hypothetical protein